MENHYLCLYSFITAKTHQGFSACKFIPPDPWQSEFIRSSKIFYGEPPPLRVLPGLIGLVSFAVCVWGGTRSYWRSEVTCVVIFVTLFSDDRTNNTSHDTSPKGSSSRRVDGGRGGGADYV